MDGPHQYRDFTEPDEMSSVTLVIENQKLHVHREILAAWSPVFRTMFLSNFRERTEKEIELPDKNLDGFVELLHCIYPPIKSITDENVHQLLPLVEEYAIFDVKKRCEEFLLLKAVSLELLVTAQTYNLSNLLEKCIDGVRNKTYAELTSDPYFGNIESQNLIHILQLRVQDLEAGIESYKKHTNERDARIYGCITELASGYGSFCTECKSRKVSDTCYNCLTMFREKVRLKCKEAQALRNSNIFDL